MRRIPLLLVLLTFATGTAWADEDRGPYLGAGVGSYTLEVDDLEGFRFDDDDTALKVFGGWRFNRYLALEGAYIDLGNPSQGFGGVNVETGLTGFAPYVVGTLPLGIFEVYGKVGYYFYDVEATVSAPGFGSESIDDSDEDLVYGVGVGVVLFEHLNARLEYERIDVSDTDTSDAFWLTGAWRF
jgi:opacity protein-like surface antigen